MSVEERNKILPLTATLNIDSLGLVKIVFSNKMHIIEEIATMNSAGILVKKGRLLDESDEGDEELEDEGDTEDDADSEKDRTTVDGKKVA